MREIIFRGKRLDNGEWVEGFYREYKMPLCWQHEAQQDGINYFIDEKDSNTSNYVLPETVGQYTERKDKTGIRIFEGDIVKIDSFIYQVEFRYSEWEFRILSKKVYCFPNFDSHTGECEIIGNIHDNTELLEVQG